MPTPTPEFRPAAAGYRRFVSRDDVERIVLEYETEVANLLAMGVEGPKHVLAVQRAMEKLGRQLVKAGMLERMLRYGTRAADLSRPRL
jgi:hypothetical protein